VLNLFHTSDYVIKYTPDHPIGYIENGFGDELPRDPWDIGNPGICGQIGSSKPLVIKDVEFEVI
jgi:hypothetical protein